MLCRCLETISALFKRSHSRHAHTDTSKHASTFIHTKGGRDAAGYAQSARSDWGIQGVGTHSYARLRTIRCGILTLFASLVTS